MSRKKNAKVGFRTHSRKTVLWVVCWTSVLSPRWQMARPALGYCHTWPPESKSHWVWFLGPSVVIDAEGMQNIEQGGEEGEE